MKNSLVPQLRVRFSLLLIPTPAVGSEVCAPLHRDGEGEERRKKEKKRKESEREGKAKRQPGLGRERGGKQESGTLRTPLGSSDVRTFRGDVAMSCLGKKNKHN